MSPNLGNATNFHNVNQNGNAGNNNNASNAYGVCPDFSIRLKNSSEYPFE